MGGEFGQWNEWNYDASLQWHLLQWASHQGLQKCVADLNRIYRREPALHQVDFDPAGFEWIDCHNYQRQRAELHAAGEGPERLSGRRAATSRRCRGGLSLGRAASAAGTRKSSTAIRCTTAAATWATAPAFEPREQPSHGRQHSIEIALSPLGVSILKPRG